MPITAHLLLHHFQQVDITVLFVSVVDLAIRMVLWLLISSGLSIEID